MSKKVLDLDDSEEESNHLNLNSDFAKNYDNWRRKEEIQKLKDKFGTNLDVLSDSDQSFVSGSDDNSDDSDSESDHSIDEQQVFDDKFFEVYSALKSKNPVIYDKNIKFYDKSEENLETEDNGSEKVKSIEKTMTLKEYHKKLIKEKKGITEEDLQSMNGLEEKPIGYYEELDQIRDEFKSVLNEDQSDGESDDQLIKGKTPQTNGQKDNCLDFLKETSVQKNDSNLEYLRNYWKHNKELEESERYLRDYIINKRYVNEKDEELYKKPNSSETKESDNESESEDSIGFKTLDDKKDNENDLKISSFHFEEPNSVSIKRYPRSVDTIRDTTNAEKRAQKRSEMKDKKKREKDRELKRLRKLKTEELKQRVEKIKEMTGNERIDFNDLDLNRLLDDDNDFDSEKYDQKMQSLFGDQYYENDNSVKIKPKFEYIPEIDDNNEPIDEFDNQFNDNDQIKGKPNKNLVKKQKKINKTMSEIGIFEDLIGGDLATRYKYRSVECNDFGLTDSEILFSSDKDLNNWCSIKKMSQYRDDLEERYDVKTYANKGQNSELKQKVLKSYYEKQNDNQFNEGMDSESNPNNNNKKRKKRSHKKPKFTIEPIGDKHKKKADNEDNGDKHNDKTNGKKRFRNRKQKTNPNESSYPGVSMDRLKAYGLSNKKIKKMNKRKK